MLRTCCVATGRVCVLVVVTVLVLVDETCVVDVTTDELVTAGGTTVDVETSVVVCVVVEVGCGARTVDAGPEALRNCVVRTVLSTSTLHLTAAGYLLCLSASATCTPFLSVGGAADRLSARRARHLAVRSRSWR